MANKGISFAEIVQALLTTVAKPLQNAFEELEQLLQQKEVNNA
jgi:hypothetical protein